MWHMNGCQGLDNRFHQSSHHVGRLMWDTPGFEWQIELQEPALPQLGHNAGLPECGVRAATPTVRVVVVAHLWNPIHRLDDVLAHHGHAVGL